MRFDAIIFDMDGVLVDSEACWLESRVEFAAGLGKTWTLADQHAAMGRNTVEWAAIMRDRLGLEGWPPDAIIEPVRGGVIRRLEARLPLLPGALDAVRTAAAHAPIGLASGSPTAVIDTVMRLSGLDAAFAVKVYGDDIAHGKPAPDIYFEAARQLGAHPSRCLGIEDSANGLRALHAAGMTAIAVPSPGFSLPPDVLALADRVLPSLEWFTPGLLKDFGRCEG
jgi:HAD superfamily hydrolase (TIGR01509 family)